MGEWKNKRREREWLIGLGWAREERKKGVGKNYASNYLVVIEKSLKIQFSIIKGRIELRVIEETL